MKWPEGVTGHGDRSGEAPGPGFGTIFGETYP